MSTLMVRVQAALPQSAPSGATPKAKLGLGAKLVAEVLDPIPYRMPEPAGGPTFVPLSKKQHVLACAENGVFWRILLNSVAKGRLKRIPKPPRITVLCPRMFGL